MCISKKIVKLDNIDFVRAAGIGLKRFYKSTLKTNWLKLVTAIFIITYLPRCCMKKMFRKV